MSVRTDAHAVLELSDATEAGVLVGCDWLATLVDDFLENERSLSSFEARFDVEILESAENDFQIAGPHVFAGVDSESGSAEVDELVQVVDEFAPDVLFSLVEINKIDQPAVSDLICITVVFNVTAAGIAVVVVHIVSTVRNTREVKGVSVEVGSASSSSAAATAAHVIRDDVDEGADADSVASTDHVGELPLVA